MTAGTLCFAYWHAMQNTSCLQSVFLLLLLLLFWVSRFILFLLFISHQAAHTTYSFRELSLPPTFEALTLCSHCAWAMEMDGQRERTHSFVDTWSQWVHNGVYIEGIPTAAGKLSSHVRDDVTASSEIVNTQTHDTLVLFVVFLNTPMLWQLFHIVFLRSNIISFSTKENYK